MTADARPLFAATSPYTCRLARVAACGWNMPKNLRAKAVNRNTVDLDPSRRGKVGGHCTQREREREREKEESQWLPAHGEGRERR